MKWEAKDVRFLFRLALIVLGFCIPWYLGVWQILRWAHGLAWLGGRT